DLWLAEFVSDLQGVGRIVDDCDCLWLTMQRQMRVGGVALKERAARWLHIQRVGRHESGLTSRVELVTTVSPVDQNVLQRRSKTRRAAIHLVPNGVAPTLVEWECRTPEIPNAVAFW